MGTGTAGQVSHHHSTSPACMRLQILYFTWLCTQLVKVKPGGWSYAGQRQTVLSTCCAQVNSFLRSDEELHSAVAAGRCGESGSTALVALVSGNQLLVANAGAPQTTGIRTARHLEATTVLRKPV